jgi:hypothetical protein
MRVIERIATRVHWRRGDDAVPARDHFIALRWLAT